MHDVINIHLLSCLHHYSIGHHTEAAEIEGGKGQLHNMHW